MASLLVCARDLGRCRKGDIVGAFANDHAFGTHETLPDFCHVLIPAISMSDVSPYVVPWYQEIEFDVVGHDAVADLYRLRLYSTTQATGGDGGYTQAQLDDLIQRWNGTTVAASGGEVEADLAVWDAFTSLAHWPVGNPVMDDLVFTQVSYDEASGDYVADIDYSATPFNTTPVEDAMAARGYTILSHAGRIVRVGFNRQSVVDRFVGYLDRQASHMVHARRYYFAEAGVDAVINNGGSMQVTLQQAQDNLRDRVAE